MDLIFVRKNVIAKRPDDVKRLIAGWRKALQYIKDEPDDAYAIMAKAFDLPTAEFRDIAGGVRWLDLAENQKLLGMEPQAPAERYGLGFMVRTGDDGVTTVGHGGSVAGYNAGLRFELDSKIGVAMLRTTSYDPPIETLLRTLVADGGRK